MEELTLERADASALAMRQALRDEPELAEFLSSWEKELRPRFNLLAVGFCFARYISAELDFQTPGDRGLGRISTEIPRLGAYFRKPMSRLSQSELSDLNFDDPGPSPRPFFSLLAEGPRRARRVTPTTPLMIHRVPSAQEAPSPPFSGPSAQYDWRVLEKRVPSRLRHLP